MNFSTEANPGEMVSEEMPEGDVATMKKMFEQMWKLRENDRAEDEYEGKNKGVGDDASQHVEDNGTVLASKLNWLVHKLFL